MNLFTNPIHLVPLLERAVEALETIAAELVTARLERAALPREGETTLEYVRRTTPTESDEDRLARVESFRNLMDDDAEEVLEEGERPRLRFKPHPIGTVSRCRECRSWRNEHEVSVTGARDLQNELPACPGGVA